MSSPFGCLATEIASGNQGFGSPLKQPHLPCDFWRTGSTNCTTAITRSAAFAEPPCQDLNLGHRPMAYPRTDKVDGRLVQARPGPVFPDVDFNRQPALSMRGWET